MMTAGRDTDPGMRELRRRQLPTLKTVAERAGVSLSTAARVLRGETSVDSELTAKVEQAAEAVGYVPNQMARTLRGGPGGMLGVMVGDMLDPYYGQIASTATEHAEAAHGQTVVVANMRRSAQLEIKLCRQLLVYRVGGLLLSGGGFDQATHADQLHKMLRRVIDAGTRVATLTPRSRGVPQEDGYVVPVFSVENYEVGRLIARSVLATGHRKVGVIAGTILNDVAAERLRGIEDELQSVGDAEWIVETGEYSIDSGFELAQLILTRFRSVSAFVCTADSVAVGALRACNAKGVRVPQDVSIVGVGATTGTVLTSPKLASVDIRLAEHTRSAIDYLVTGELEVPAFEPTLVAGGSLDAPG